MLSLTGFDSAKVTNYNYYDGWGYNDKTVVFTNSSTAVAQSRGLSYNYVDHGITLGVRARFVNVQAAYSWSDAPQGVLLPVDYQGSESVSAARASRDTTYCKGYTFQAPEGSYVFSGWDEGDLDDYGYLRFSGSWTFKPGAGPSTSESRWSRVYGESAYDTMQAVLRKDGHFWTGRGGTVILATGDGYWDALAASGLAGITYAPIVTTPTGSLGPQATAELQRLNPERVIVMGGTFAVSDNAYAQVGRVCPDAIVTRVYGEKADDTAVAAYEAALGLGWDWEDTCIVATVNGYWDALSIAPYAYMNRAPIFLTNGATNRLSASTVGAIRNGGFTRVVIVGGTGVVPASVEGQLSGLTVIRLAGQNAIDTSAAIASWEVHSEGMTTRHMAIATSGGYWDALSGAPLVGDQNSVLVLAAEGQYQAIDAVYQCGDGRVEGGYVLGGEMAVPDSVWRYVTIGQGDGSVG